MSKISRSFILSFILSLLLLPSCKEDPIPTVTLEMLPTELVSLGDSMLFDTTHYQIIEYIVDTITVDSIVRDTLVTDTFSVDTFWMDTICLYGSIAYAGKATIGPTVNEYGFCINDYLQFPIWWDLLSNPDTFAYVMPVRYDDKMYIHAYAINPFGIVRSQTIYLRMSDLDNR